MKILERLVRQARRRAKDLKISRLEAGRYLAVQLEDGAVGLAINEMAGKRAALEASMLVGAPVEKALFLLQDSDLGRRALGLACANALFNRPAPDLREADAAEIVLAGAEDRVGMVGFFRPIFERLRRRCRELLVFERQDQRESFLLPAEGACRLLPTCRSAIITASALVNGTLEELLGVCNDLEQVILVGPSTPLCREVFRNTPIKWLCGTIVRNAPAVLEKVAAGEGMPALRGLVSKVCLEVR